MEYKIKKIEIVADGVADINFPYLRDRVIEKTGSTVEFTMRQVQENTQRLENAKKEIEPMMRNAEGKISNVDKFHPIVKTLTGQQLIAAHMYKEAKDIVDQATAKLAEINKVLEAETVEIAEIIRQVPELANLEEEIKKEEEAVLATQTEMMGEVAESKKKTNGKTKKAKD